VKDVRFMRRALELAALGRGRTSPNPMVGAVVVRDGQVVGEGYHAHAGGPHAEVVALTKAGAHARGATLYLNLEPCCHHGRTPPCTKLIIAQGIGCVVAAMEDPNPQVSGAGAAELRAQGIQVDVGMLRAEAERLNEAFVTYMSTGRPFVLAKAAMSLDGKIATASGESRWISSEESLLLVHELRDQVDAVMVGVGTVLRDDPELTTRLPGRRCRDPKRVIVDSTLRTPLEARVLAHPRPQDTFVATTELADREKVKQVEERGATVLVLGQEGGRVKLPELAERLAQMGITYVMIEGGSRLMGGALDANIVHKVLFIIAPKIIGGAAAPGAIAGLGAQTMGEVRKLHDFSVRRLGDDILVEGYLTR